MVPLAGQATIDEMTETVEVYADPADRATAESDRALTLLLETVSASLSRRSKKPSRALRTENSASA